MPLCYIRDGVNFIKLAKNGKPTVCGSKSKQLFEVSKAHNILKNIPNELKRYDWAIYDSILNTQIYPVVTETEYVPAEELLQAGTPACKRNHFEFTGTDIFANLNSDEVLETLLSVNKIVKQLPDYANDCACKVREIDMEVEDILHYLREPGTKLNIVQAGKLVYFMQDRLRKRNDYKKKARITKLASEELTVISPPIFEKTIRSEYDSDYKPRRLTYTMLDSIIGAHCHTSSTAETEVIEENVKCTYC